MRNRSTDHQKPEKIIELLSNHLFGILIRIINNNLSILTILPIMMKIFRSLDDNERKDVRKYFKERPLSVNCKTEECEFDALITNVSASGVFIKTEKPLKVGQEIAMIFSFSSTGQTTMATGKVARTDLSGAGIEIKILFKND